MVKANKFLANKEKKPRNKTTREKKCIKKLPSNICIKQYCHNSCNAKECRYYKK